MQDSDSHKLDSHKQRYDGICSFTTAEVLRLHSPDLSYCLQLFFRIGIHLLGKNIIRVRNGIAINHNYIYWTFLKKNVSILGHKSCHWQLRKWFYVGLTLLRKPPGALINFLYLLVIGRLVIIEGSSCCLCVSQAPCSPLTLCWNSHKK